MTQEPLGTSPAPLSLCFLLSQGTCPAAKSSGKCEESNSVTFVLEKTRSSEVSGRSLLWGLWPHLQLTLNSALDSQKLRFRNRQIFPPLGECHSVKSPRPLPPSLRTELVLARLALCSSTCPQHSIEILGPLQKPNLPGLPWRSSG